MNKGIIICGLNGSGKSTLGRALGKELNYKLIDVEDYYFNKTTSDYTYDKPRAKEEVIKLILNDIKKHGNFIMTAVTGNYGEEISSKFTHAIVIDVPKEIRMERVRKRSFDKFGDRINPGGDLYEKEKDFFNMVAERKNDIVDNWVKTLSCKIIRIDGTKDVEQNMKFVIEGIM